jgi:hypothetical protein
MENVVKILQHEVQRKLGRCLIRLQQYERVLKAMVASIAVDGQLEQLQARRAKQQAGARNKTLGELVGTFTGCHLTPAPSKGETEPDDTSSGESTDVAWASMRFNISMSPERYSQTKAGLAELVALRNDLVHHLIERFDISEENGCRAASSHLDSCYEQIDGHCQLLKTWATGLTESRALVSSFLQSKVFEDAFVHGINPDGSVCWPRSSIVECLREAETACQVDGWTSLDAAILYILRTAPDQVPSRYGCKTWRQVLNKYEEFESRSDPGSDGKRGEAWYRSCVKSTAL